MDYESASTRDKERINLLVTSNSTGKSGCCIPLDMLCEHKVRSVKELLRSFHSQIETLLVSKSVLAQNSIGIMKEHFLGSLGQESYMSGGEHRHEYFSEEDKKCVRGELQKLKLFHEDSQKKEVTFHLKIRRVWEDLTDEKIEIFLDRNSRNFKAKNTYRFT